MGGLHVVGASKPIAIPATCRQIQPMLPAKACASMVPSEATMKGELREQILDPESWLLPKHK